MDKFKRLPLLFLFLVQFQAIAEEGMWLPNLISGILEQKMQELGLELSAEDIYSTEQSSLKDAIVNFGGCTASLISPSGLLLTNHHCGYSFIQRHSTVENDLLTDGYWAFNREQELPNPGFKVSIVKGIEDVTADLRLLELDQLPDNEREEKVKSAVEALIRTATAGTHYDAFIRPFYEGNQYYLFVIETFSDIRLVGAPPSSIGKFGGNTDNWMWPRHTGDFSLFRIFVGRDGKPAEYSPDNEPYQPEHYLPVNIGGVKPGDFTLVFGFPGRTAEYLTSTAVKLTVNLVNPARIGIREKKLAILSAAMQENAANRINYAAQYASIANYYKKWQGENWGLKKYNALEAKLDLENRFSKWASSSPDLNQKYGRLYPRFDSVYAVQEDYLILDTYQKEAIYGIELFRLSRSVASLLENNLREDEFREELERRTSNFYRSYRAHVDQQMFAAMLELYFSAINPEFQPDVLVKEAQKYRGDFQKMAADYYQKSWLSSPERFQKNQKLKYKAFAEKFADDPITILETAFRQNHTLQVIPVLYSTEKTLTGLYQVYLQGLMKFNGEKSLYPDANSTLRIAYGKVEGCIPHDGLRYLYKTDLQGVMAKANPDDPEFTVPDKLNNLYESGDFGTYAAPDGSLPVCFLASNHTTGGNSGSPVINGRGELIGLNFDRSWESTMSDIYYSPEICRNISVDMRYVLFIIDKFAGATHLVEEMELVNQLSPAESELFR